MYKKIKNNCALRCIELYLNLWLKLEIYIVYTK